MKVRFRQSGGGQTLLVEIKGLLALRLPIRSEEVCELNGCSMVRLQLDILGILNVKIFE